MLSHISSSALAIIALSITLLVPTSHALPYPNPSASPAPTTTVSAAAVPSPTAAAGNETAAAAAGITLAQLEKAYAPNCLATVPPGFPDAITCKDALPFINSAIKKYGLETAGEKAAYLATMAYEGAYLKYNHNLGDPSQGISPKVLARLPE
ncbi:hypothetical protein B0O80DRAFT_201630 [Mortierella sp. GBAus27b]|nr:hypothetical protein B0O80DRAFT_201630 [Mortierella sp. GBAus27b]